MGIAALLEHRYEWGCTNVILNLREKRIPQFLRGQIDDDE